MHLSAQWLRILGWAKYALALLGCYTDDFEFFQLNFYQEYNNTFCTPSFKGHRSFYILVLEVRLSLQPLSIVFEEERKKKLMRKVMQKIEGTPEDHRQLASRSFKFPGEPLSRPQLSLIDECSGSEHGLPRFSLNFIGAWRQ
ncbi:hypothetical protein TNCV_4198481 [Trichonephila clavipes]|nr:hypothetical protein TNCV_4198481 [Trichonephila clavipes]